ncbi:MAG: hypothetical protein EBR92_02685, partial [Alphaproteobacteria bacterium]|nr:hypothetical protein [Alphaproteobacteria bacterium]
GSLAHHWAHSSILESPKDNPLQAKEEIACRWWAISTAGSLWMKTGARHDVIISTGWFKGRFQGLGQLPRSA